MVGIKAMFGMKSVMKVFDDVIEGHKEKMIEVLQYEGEAFVNRARMNNTYWDETGNLRSSIGYAIVFNGIVVHQNFKLSGSGGDRETGKLEAMDLASDLAEEYNRGWVLIGIAGMDYAAAVESRGFDVITNSANQVDIKQYFNNDISI